LSAINFIYGEFRKLQSPRIAPRLNERRSELYVQHERVRKQIARLERHLLKKEDEKGSTVLRELTDEYSTERNAVQRQIELVEDLAGVGIAVDATSHDIMLVLGRVVEGVSGLRTLARQKPVDIERVRDKLDALQGQCLFVEGLMKGIQPLFRSSRRYRKDLNVADVVRTVVRYYQTAIQKSGIKVDVQELETPLVVSCSEGVLLQLFINLMDNAVFWLRRSGIPNPRILVQIDGTTGSATFADNGPGVAEEDIDYIFDAFFSRKGIHGRGLGLYIARQLTDKYEYDLYYVRKTSKKVLPGANFRIDFVHSRT
jgi:signal transduction histidine kinase